MSLPSNMPSQGHGLQTDSTKMGARLLVYVNAFEYSHHFMTSKGFPDPFSLYLSLWA